MSKRTENEAQKFLKEIDIRKNQFVVDFGCGKGSYSVPAWFVVGKKGRISILLLWKIIMPSFYIDGYY